MGIITHNTDHLTAYETSLKELPQQEIQVSIPITRRVILGTPSFTGQVEVNYVHSLLNTIKLCKLHNIEVYPVHMSYNSMIHMARNDIFKIAVETQVDDLVFVDGDQEWEPLDFLKLLNHPVDLVGGTVVRKNDVETYNVKCLEWPIPKDLKTGLYKVDSVGGGFVRISKRGIQKMWENSKEYENGRMVYETQIIEGQLYSEDVYFCKKWKDLNEEVYIDGTITCSHIGVKKWTGNFEKWLSTISPTR